MPTLRPMGRFLQRELQTGLFADRFRVSVSDFRWADHAGPAGRSPHTPCRAEEHTEEMSPKREQVGRASTRPTFSALRAGSVYSFGG
jgi:hypothetical protein